MLFCLIAGAMSLILGLFFNWGPLYFNHANDFVMLTLFLMAGFIAGFFLAGFSSLFLPCEIVEKEKELAPMACGANKERNYLLLEQYQCYGITKVWYTMRRKEDGNKYSLPVESVKIYADEKSESAILRQFVKQPKRIIQLFWSPIIPADKIATWYEIFLPKDSMTILPEIPPRR